jgi:rubrerythrin
MAETYFNLKTAHSYKMSGLSGRRYCFYKDKPVEVTDTEDADKFRMHSDLFYECASDGSPIISETTHKSAKTFVTFRQSIANRDETIEESNKQAEEQRKSGIDINVLLDEANKDVNENTASTSKIVKQAKQTKQAKKEKNPLECELCGYIAKDLDDLREHLDKHGEED